MSKSGISASAAVTPGCWHATLIGLVRARDNWIFVARALARTYGKDRYVLKGSGPADCSFSAAKEDFVLFSRSNGGRCTAGR
jgi:hypothetical protein